ncbi:MAG: acyl-CoA thioesterase [Candidatus Eisenbacteria bacterium]|uniref:Acyl-CoA thioesterase n=1 Tax=Eiseniibacteriota bacterium TaxID=2212470 RepID=A0A956LVK4_UNCEI|nr:acyl-CoA thioesterase [Candidatus Eisenbacteria bacterium]
MTELVLPNDANTLGNVLGGKVLHLIDIAAAVCAHRHCRRQVVTASMDRVDFLHPVKVGEVMILRASVNYVARTSMEVGVKVECEDLMTGVLKKTASAYATFVALDEGGRPIPVPGLIKESPDQERRFREGAERREQRMAELARRRAPARDDAGGTR